MDSTNHHCPLCSKLVFESYRFGLLRCVFCTLVISPLIWDPQSNERMEDEWFGEGYEARKSSIWVRFFEALNNRNTLERLIRFPQQGRRLLEIGVGSGSFLKAAVTEGFDVMGCDLSVPICREVKLQYKINVHCGFISELQENNKFDMVVMNHVLEHVQRPVEFLQDVFRLLAPGGIAHIAVPNIDCYEAHLSGWASYEPYHLTYFNQSSLERSCSAAGFSIVKVISRESFSGWFLALLRTLLQVNHKHGAVVRSPAASTLVNLSASRPRFISHAYRLSMVIFGVGLWPLRWFQGKLGHGDEIVCIVRKPPFYKES